MAPNIERVKKEGKGIFMKIVALVGSPHGEKSQTLRLARALVAGAEKAGAVVETVDVCRLKIKYCKGCDACHAGGPCAHKDGFGALYEKLLAADGLVFCSPDYFRTVTAQMKTVIDRLSQIIHCQLFAGKYACSVVTSGGPAYEEVVRYLAEVIVSLGAYDVGSAGVGLCQGPQAFAQAEERARALGRELAEAIRTRRVYPDQAKRHEQTASYFRRLVEMNKDRWPYEYSIWAKRAAPAAGA
jgi:multimeric flavodoxin WrbA